MRLLGAGDNVIDRYPDLGRYFPGGNAVNVAVAARRAGAEAAYLGVLGADEAGRHVGAALESEGIDVSRVRWVQGVNAWVDIHRQDGDRMFGDHDLGVSPFRLDSADVDYAATFDIVHLCADCFLEDDAAELASRTRLSFDFKLRRSSSYLRPLLAATTYAFFSAADLGEQEAVSLLEAAIDQGAEVAVATRGPGDSLAISHGALVRQAPIQQVPLDTLGAGDAFIGSFLVRHEGGDAIETTMAAAAEAAAETCRHHGAFGYGHPYMPTVGVPYRPPPSEVPSLAASPAPREPRITGGEQG